MGLKGGGQKGGDREPRNELGGARGVGAPNLEKSGPEGWEPRSVEGQEGRGAGRVELPIFALFFSPTPIFVFPSFLQYVRGFFCVFEGPDLKKKTQKFHERTPRAGDKIMNIWMGEEKTIFGAVQREAVQRRVWLLVVGWLVVGCLVVWLLSVVVVCGGSLLVVLLWLLVVVGWLGGLCVACCGLLVVGVGWWLGGGWLVVDKLHTCSSPTDARMAATFPSLPRRS